jgi:hypothetical protein
MMVQRPSRQPDGAAAPIVQVHLSRRVLTVLAVLWIVPWLILAWLLFGPLLHPGAFRFASSTTTRSEDESITVGKPGPWGCLEYMPLRLDLPDEFVALPAADGPPVRWLLKGYTEQRAVEFLREAGLTAAQLDTLQKAGWQTTPDGVAVEPGDELILQLSPTVRAKVYGLLIEFPENVLQLDPIWFRPGQVDERLKDSGLSPSSLALLKRLLYPQGPTLLLFADLQPALRKLPDDAERRRFVKAISRKKTLLARLPIDADSDMEAAINYWSVGGRRKDVAPLLNAARHEGECKLNIVCLLPHFVRDHLYTYPFSTSNPVAAQNSFWSAMNVFYDPPEDRFSDMEYVGRALEADYYNIAEPSKLGDLIFLTTPSKRVVHAAAYVADDVVFTKNGDTHAQPWIFMHMADMIDTHAVRHPTGSPLQPVYYRQKSR